MRHQKRHSSELLNVIMQGWASKGQGHKDVQQNVELMFTKENPTFQYLDQVVTPPAPSNTTIKWSVRYLVEKVEEFA